MKSICTTACKVTAKELGVKVGDKFIVLHREDCHENLTSLCFDVGDKVVLVEDDDSATPRFWCKEKGELGFDHFSCLALYEEPKEEKTVLDKVKFDMKAVAEELGVPLKTAHKFVQEMLFEQGCKWNDDSTSVYCPDDFDIMWLYLEEGLITYDRYPYETTQFQTYGVKIEKSFYKIEEPEIIVLNGKKYKLID